MDDFLTKPIELKRLKSILLRWLATPGLSERETEHKTSPSENAIQVPINFEQIRLYLGEDERLHHQFIERFIEKNRSNIDDFHAGNKVSLTTLKQMAHQIKSSARAIGAEALGNYCDQLENSQSDDQSAENQEIRQKIISEFDAVCRFAESYFKS